MKRFALLVLFILCLAAPAFAINGVGDVSVYADIQGNACNITNPGSGFLQVHIVHKFLPGEQANGCRFKLALPAEFTFFGFTTTFTPVGDLQTDISLGYGVCLTSNTLLGTVNMGVNGPSATCTYLTIAAATPIYTEVIATSCEAAELVMGAGQAIINPDAGCQCQVATEATSWGKVKALYR